MAAPELRLNVTLDLAAFRAQLGKLAQTSAAYYYPVNLQINKKNFEAQLKALAKIKPVIQINDSQIQGAKDRLVTLNRSLATLRKATSIPIEIKVKYKEEGVPASGASAIGRAVTGRTTAQQALESKSRGELQKLYGLFREANLRVGELSKSLAKSSADEIKNALIPAFSDSGEEAVNGLAVGLKDPSSKVSKAAERLAKTTIQDTKKAFGIASPSRAFKEIGQDIVEGLELGLEDFNTLRTKMVGEMRQFITAIKREARVGGIALGGLLSPITRPTGSSTRTVPGIASPTRAGASTDPGRGNQRILNSLSLLTGNPALYRGRMANLGAGRLPSSLLGAAQNQFDLEELAPSFKQARLASGVSPLDKIIDEAFFGRGTLPKAQSALSTLNNSLERLGNAAKAALPSGILQSASGNPRMRAFGGVAPSQTMGVFQPTARQTAYPPSGGFLEFSRRATAISAGLPGNVFGGSGAPRNTLGGFGGSSRGGGGGGGGGGGFPSDGMMGPSTTKGYEALTRLSGALRQSSVFFNQAKIPLAGAIEELGGEFAQAAKQVLLYGTAYKALAFFTDLPRQVLAASTSLQTFNNQLLAITGSSAGAERSFTFVDNLATRFNVPLESARQGFVRLYASMAPAGFETGQIEALYTGISKASATLGLSADKVDRVTYAFAQMSSKGQLMAEEVTGQLGDVIPGALSLMAEAARMDIATFKKAMEDGAFTGKAFEQVMSNVPIVLERRFGKGAAGAAQTLQGSMNALATATTKFYESFNALVQSGGAAIFPVIADAIDQATKAATAFSAAATGNMGPANMLEGTAKNLYIAMRQLQEIFIAVGSVIKGIAPTFVILGQSALGLLGALSQLINTAVGRFLADLTVKAGVALIAIQLLTKTGITLLASQLIMLARNAQLAGTGFVGFAKGLMATATAARIARLALIGLGAGLVLMGIEALITYIDRAANRLGNMRKAALDAAGAIRSMSSAQLVQEKTQRQKDIALLERVQRSGGDIGSEAERKRLEEMGLQTGTRGVQRRVMDPSLVESYLQRERQLLTEVDYAYKNLDQPPPALGEVDAAGGKDNKTKKTSLESYYSLQDQLAKNFTQAEIDRQQAMHDQRMALQNEFFNQQEARANSFQKEAIKFQRELASIENERKTALLKASQELMKAQGSVAGGATGASTTGATGLLQGSTGISSGPHFDIRRADGSFISPDQARALLDPAVRRRLTTTSAYGPRNTGIPGASTFHRGVDLAGPANTPLNLAPGYSMVGQGEEGGLGYAATVRGPQGEMYKVGHLQRPQAGAARKVPGSEKRDLIAAQQVQIANSQQITIGLNAEQLAYEKTKTAIANYVASIFSPEEQALQNSLLAKRGELISAGMEEDAIELEMKRYEIQEKVNIGLADAKKLLENKGISQEAYNELVAKLNNLLPTSNKLLGEQNALLRDNVYKQRIADLKEEIKLLRIINDEERRLAELTKEFKGDKVKAQEVFDLEKIKKNIEDTRSLIRDFVSSTASDYKGFLKAVISGEDAGDALKQFQEGLKDRVLTIFLDFAMAPVEKFFKESLEGLFLPKGEKLPGTEIDKEVTKDPVEATNSNTNATNTNTEAIKNLTNVLSTASAEGAQQATSSLSAAMQSIGGVAFDTNVGAAPMQGFDAASVFGDPEALKGSFAGLQESLSQSMGGISSSFDNAASSISETLPSWNEALAIKIPESLTKATDNTDAETPNFQESLGKVAQGIGIAAGTIMGIASGIGQIKEGGTANILGGIGSILTSIGGGIGGFTKLFGANGGVAGGGWKPFPVTAFANGGMVNGPTLGLVGEGKYNEAIVPLPDGRSIPVQMTGAGSGSLRDAMGQTPGQGSAPILNMSFESTNINGVEYVSRDQLEQAMAQTRRQASRDGAQRGMSMTLDKLQQSPSTRSRIGIR